MQKCVSKELLDCLCLTKETRDEVLKELEPSVIRQIKRCLFRQIKTGLSERYTMV